MEFEEKIRRALEAQANRAVQDQHGPLKAPVLAHPRRRGVASLATRSTIALGVLAAAIAVAVVVATTTGGGRSSIEAGDGGLPTGSGPVFLGQDGSDPYRPTYPDSDKVSGVAAAQRQVEFDLVVPDTQWANELNLMSTFVLPGGAVAFDFPAPEEPKSYVRQAYIEVYEAPWNPAWDPKEFYGRSLEEAPNPDSFLTEIEGLPALVVKPHSSADSEGANPAFIRFVTEGIEIQISGGEDLSILEAIAAQLIEASRASGQ